MPICQSQPKRISLLSISVKVLGMSLGNLTLVTCLHEPISRVRRMEWSDWLDPGQVFTPGSGAGAEPRMEWSGWSDSGQTFIPPELGLGRWWSMSWWLNVFTPVKSGRLKTGGKGAFPKENWGVVIRKRANGCSQLKKKSLVCFQILLPYRQEFWKPVYLFTCFYIDT